MFTSVYNFINANIIIIITIITKEASIQTS